MLVQTMHANNVFYLLVSHSDILIYCVFLVISIFDIMICFSLILHIKRWILLQACQQQQKTTKYIKSYSHSFSVQWLYEYITKPPEWYRPKGL
jgi:hypothetical protein